MHSESFNGLARFRQVISKTKVAQLAWTTRCLSPRGRILWFAVSFCLCFEFALQGQQPGGSVPPVGITNVVSQTPAEHLVALQLELTNAWQRVVQIVNRPVTAYVRTENLQVSVYSPGWFHEGAIKPDFNNVDVRRSQELIYAQHLYVSSDLNPGRAFLGRDLEFNAMTKFFYVNRSLPKRKLTEAEMIEINRLYRIIGRCESEIMQLENPAVAESASSSNVESNAEPAVAPSQALAGIRSIPQQTRLLYGGIAIGVLVVLVVALRFARKKSE